MSAGGDQARVTSVAALAALRPAVVKFAEQAQAAVSATESSASRTLDWLTREQRPHWQREVRRLQEEVVRARTRMVSRMGGGVGPPTARTDDRLDLDRVKRQLANAEEKLARTARWIRELERRFAEYRGAMAPLGWFVRSELGRAVGALELMGDALDAYVREGSERRSSPQEEDGGEGGEGGGA